jgi:CRP-like cAMP-binding protein
MEPFLPRLQHCPLFSDCPEALLRQHILPQATLRTAERNAQLLCPQERVERFGVVVSGRIQVMQLFSDGVNSLMDVLSPGDLLGVDALCTPQHHAPYYAIAATPVEVLFFPGQLLLGKALPDGAGDNPLWPALRGYLAQENLQKHYRLAILSQRGLRTRILIFLTMQAGRAGADTFRIPFSREELASYLCVNRSALSHELSQMAQEGLISFHKDAFTLLEPGKAASPWICFAPRETDFLP